MTAASWVDSKVVRWAVALAVRSVVARAASKVETLVDSKAANWVAW